MSEMQMASNQKIGVIVTLERLVERILSAMLHFGLAQNGVFLFLSRNNEAFSTTPQADPVAPCQMSGGFSPKICY